MNLVLLHAFPLDERMWAGQRETLGGYEAEALRLYGRGRTMDAWARSILDETDGELVIVGTSMGGYCALALAAIAPERVRALLLAGSRPDPDTDERRAARADTIELIRTEGPEALWRSMIPKLFADESHADASLLYRDPDGLVAAVEAIRDRQDSTDVARALGDRLTFVVGDSDPFVSVSELSAFNTIEVRNASHLVNIDQPGEFNRILREFLERV